MTAHVERTWDLIESVVRSSEFVYSGVRLLSTRFLGKEGDERRESGAIEKDSEAGLTNDAQMKIQMWTRAINKSFVSLETFS
jgi:hypothetical protein